MAKKEKPAKRAKVVPPPGGWQQAQKKVPEFLSETRAKRAPDINWHESDFNDRQLVWRFSEVDVQWEHLTNTLDNRAILTIIGKLRSFESMRLGELFQPGSDHAKKYEVANIPPHALRRLQEISRDDEDELVRLRLSNKGRLYGIMRGHVFNVLWWDPHHKVWPSTKKNT